jgi:hypothetical protein
MLDIFAQKKYVTTFFKNKKKFKKKFKKYLIFMKCVVSIKHCDYICWNKFVNQVKSLIIIKSQMGSRQ